MKSRPLIAAVVAASISAAVWALSLWITGHNEPWDAESLYFVAALFAGGLISGALVPKPLWAHYVGSVSGQVIYELLFLKVGPLLVLGIAFLLGYSLFFLTGAFVGSRTHLHFTRPPATA